jgi:hypothetical protein
MHSKVDVSKWRPEDLIGAFLMLETPPVSAEQWLAGMKAALSVPEPSDEEKRIANGRALAGMPGVKKES